MIAAGLLLILAAALAGFLLALWVTPLGAFAVGVAVGCGGALVGVGVSSS